MPSARGLIQIAPRITDSSANHSIRRLPTRRLSHVPSRIPLLVSAPQDHARVPLSCLVHPAPLVPAYACVSLPSAQRYMRLSRHSSGPTRPLRSCIRVCVLPLPPSSWTHARPILPSIIRSLFLIALLHSLFPIDHSSLSPFQTTRLLPQTFPN